MLWRQGTSEAYLDWFSIVGTVSFTSQFFWWHNHKKTMPHIPSFQSRMSIDSAFEEDLDDDGRRRGRRRSIDSEEDLEADKRKMKYMATTFEEAWRAKSLSPEGSL